MCGGSVADSHGDVARILMVSIVFVDCASISSD